MAGQRAAAPSTRCASPGEILCSLRERELCHDHAVGNETLICRVNWSGANSAHARFAARDVLATTIRSMRDRHPHAQRRAGAGPDGEMA